MHARDVTVHIVQHGTEQLVAYTGSVEQTGHCRASMVVLVILFLGIERTGKQRFVVCGLISSGFDLFATSTASLSFLYHLVICLLSWLVFEVKVLRSVGPPLLERTSFIQLLLLLRFDGLQVKLLQAFGEVILFELPLTSG